MYGYFYIYIPGVVQGVHSVQQEIETNIGMDRISDLFISGIRQYIRFSIQPGRISGFPKLIQYTDDYFYGPTRESDSETERVTARQRE